MSHLRGRLSLVQLAVVVALVLAACAPRRPSAALGVATAGGARPRAEPPGPIRHAIIVTVDGLLPEAYLNPDRHGLRVPTLRRMAQQGAFSTGARSVFPTVTYPAHTSIATGVSPLRHGIHTNRADDPLETNLDGWQWYAEDVKAPTLWQVAARAGYRTALVGWPVTVGASATFLVPEFWRARHADDLKLLRALSSPGLLEQVARAAPSFASRYTPGDFQKDDFVTEIAAYVVSTGKPHLSLVHLVEVDTAQHKHGLWSEAARAAIENADQQLERLIAAASGAGIWSETAIVVASDHGFASVATMVRPGVLLRRAGLVELDATNRVVGAKALLQMSGGMGYVYLRDPRDALSATTLRRIFAEQLALPDGGIGRMFEPAAIRAAGGDPRALFAFEAAPGSSFGPGYAGDYHAPPIYLATHGFSPERPDMHAALLMFGPHVPAGPIGDARLIDVAPTVAGWLGLRIPGAEGRPLVR